MSNSMTTVVKNIIAGSYKYKNEIKDRAKYISDCMKNSYSSINWCVIIYESGHGHGAFDNASTSYYYWCKIDGTYIIVIGFSK